MRTSRNDIDGLKQLVDDLPSDLVGIEIGSYAGESAEIFASSGKFKTLYCVDFWKEGFYPDRGTAGAELLFDRVSKRYSCIKKVKTNSDHIVAAFHTAGFPPVQIDFIYIDGGHDYDQVCRDIVNAHILLNGQGILAGHDYVPEFPGVMKAVDELVRPDKFYVDSSWLKNLYL